MTKSVRFYFDYISPYAYLAWMRVRDVVEARGGVVEPVPVLFAALLNHHGQLGPAEIPSKRAYIVKDVMRSAARIGAPFGVPPSHPFNPLLGLRVTSLDMDPATRTRLVDALFACVWGGGGEGITDAVHVDALAARLGVPDAVERAQHPETKARVKAQTEEAIAAGAFGVPSMVTGGELFWGFDSLEHLGRYLDGDDPVDEAVLETWRAKVKPSAVRRKPGDQ